MKKTKLTKADFLIAAIARTILNISGSVYTVISKHSRLKSSLWRVTKILRRVGLNWSEACEIGESAISDLSRRKSARVPNSRPGYFGRFAILFKEGLSGIPLWKEEHPVSPYQGLIVPLNVFIYFFTQDASYVLITSIYITYAHQKYAT